MESMESVESVWTMEEERDKGYKVSPAESVPKVPDTSEDPLTAIEDTGLYQREASSDVDSEPTRGSESSCFLGCTSSDSMKTENSKVASVCSTDEVYSGQDVRHTQTRSVAPSVAGLQTGRDKSSELNRQMKNHSERDMGNWKCTRDVGELKDKSHNDKLPKDKCEMDKCQKNKFSKDKCSKEKFLKDEFTKDTSPEDNCCKETFPNDEFPKDTCPNDKYSKEKVECHKDTSPKDKSPMEKSPKDKCHKDKSRKDKSLKDKYQKDKDKSPMEKSPKDKSLMDKYPKDRSPKDKSPKEQRIYLRSKRRRSPEASVLSDSEPGRTSRSGTTEQRKLRLKKRVTPSTPPEPPFCSPDTTLHSAGTCRQLRL